MRGRLPNPKVLSMDSTLFLVIMVIMAAANLWLGKRAAAETKTGDDFYLGGRSLGIVSLMLTILATQIGGGTILGAAEEAYQRGWIVLFYPLGTSLGLCLVALGFGAKVREMELTTIAEIFEKVFGCVLLRQIASVISIVSLFIILVAQGIAAQKFFAAAGFTEGWFFLAFWLILVTYTVLGGLKAVVNTDILQVVFIIAAFGIAFFACSFEGDIPKAATPVVFDGNDVPWLGWLLMPCLFMFIEQDMGQRFFAAKTARSVTAATWTAAFVMIACTSIPIYFGIQAATNQLDMAEGSSVLLSAINATTNPVVTTFATVAILMAVISTADTLLCSVSSNVGYDFPFMRHKGVVWAQGITLVVGVLSLIASYCFTNVVAVLIFSYELSVSALFVPVIMGVFAKKHYKEQAYASVIVGTASFLFFRMYPVFIPREILTLVLSYTAYQLPPLLCKGKLHCKVA